MKIFKYFFIMLLLFGFASGCAKEKELIDVTTVKSVMEEHNINVNDTTDKYGYATQAYYGYKDDIKINFVL